jgi:hypothetical protein
MISRRQLLLLADKYERLLALHRQQPERSPARRQAMLEVATRFPGALREWQAVPEAELQRRRDSLAIWLATPSPPSELPAWVAYSWDLHAWLRLILRLRQQIRTYPESERLATAHRFCDEIGEPQLQAAVTSELLAQVDYPGGRQLAQIAYVQVAAQHGVAIAAIKAALFLAPVAAVASEADADPDDDADRGT